MIYVLQVQTGKELAVRVQLLREGIAADVPRERIIIRKGGLWSKMVKNLFPGYVFVDIDLTPEMFHRINPVPGVIRFLGNPTPLPEHEAEMIRWLSNGGKIIEPSTVISLEDEQIVCDGFLAGHEDKIKYLNLRQKKVAVEVRFGEKTHRANLSVENIGMIGQG